MQNKNKKSKNGKKQNRSSRVNNLGKCHKDVKSHIKQILL